ncbi:hypothetical protein Osc2_07970 [Ruminococcus sp. 25CYCFAH16]
MNANKSRGIIILLSFLAVIFSFAFENQIISLIFMAVSMISAVFVLYRHINELTSLSDDNPKGKSLKAITIFNVTIFLICVVIAVLIGAGIVSSDNDGRYFAAMIVSAVILFGGNIAPKLPFSKHTGLRLPWTVTDEKAWIAAHRIIGYISIPLAFIYIAGVAAINSFEILTLVAMVTWIAIPAVFSYIVYKKDGLR